MGSKVLETTVDRLNHAGYVLPQGRYFLNRLRRLLAQCQKNGPQKMSLNAKEDVELWKVFLEVASQKGVDINAITFSDPTKV